MLNSILDAYERLTLTIVVFKFLYHKERQSKATGLTLTIVVFKSILSDAILNNANCLTLTIVVFKSSLQPTFF